jgi:inner membrane protein
MIEYINQHHSEFWLLAGLALLVLEVLLGFAAGVFLFAGLGGLLTGGLMAVGLLPETWIAGIASAGVGSGLSALLLWQPLKRLQRDKPAEKDNSSDLVGYEFVSPSDVSAGNPGKYHYSGIDWRLELDAGAAPIGAGDRVKVVSVEVGVFKVRVLSGPAS